jgi:hypothetical protein
LFYRFLRLFRVNQQHNLFAAQMKMYWNIELHHTLTVLMSMFCIIRLMTRHSHSVLPMSFPFPFTYFPFIHLQVQPKDVERVKMLWHNVSVKWHNTITIQWLHNKILIITWKYNNLEYILFIRIKIFLNRIRCVRKKKSL